jgi:hypothetical protein
MTTQTRIASAGRVEAMNGNGLKEKTKARASIPGRKGTNTVAAGRLDQSLPYSQVWHQEPTSKPPAQRDRILALLRKRGAAGAMNWELNSYCLRYGARIFELRRLGLGSRRAEIVNRFTASSES